MRIGLCVCEYVFVCVYVCCLLLDIFISLYNIITSCVLGTHPASR